MSTVNYHIAFNEDTIPDWDGEASLTTMSDTLIVIDGGPSTRNSSASSASAACRSAAR